jgi:hypothetical protein
MQTKGLLECSKELSISTYAKPDQSTPYHPISLRSILILYTHLRLGLPNGLFPSVFPAYNLHAFLLSLICFARLIILELIILTILGEEYKLRSSSLYVRFEVSTAVTLKNAVFWDPMSCGSC